MNKYDRCEWRNSTTRHAENFYGIASYAYKSKTIKCDETRWEKKKEKKKYRYIYPIYVPTTTTINNGFSNKTHNLIFRSINIVYFSYKENVQNSQTIECNEKKMMNKWCSHRFSSFAYIHIVFFFYFFFIHMRFVGFIVCCVAVELNPFAAYICWSNRQR